MFSIHKAEEGTAKGRKKKDEQFLSASLSDTFPHILLIFNIHKNTMRHYCQLTDRETETQELKIMYQYMK